MYILDISFALYQYRECFEKYKNVLSVVEQERISYTINELDNITLNILNITDKIFEHKYLSNYKFNNSFPHDINYIDNLITKIKLPDHEKRIRDLFKTLILSLRSIVIEDVVFNKLDFINKVLKNEETNIKNNMTECYYEDDKKDKSIAYKKEKYDCDKYIENFVDESGDKPFDKQFNEPVDKAAAKDGAKAKIEAGADNFDKGDKANKDDDDDYDSVDYDVCNLEDFKNNLQNLNIPYYDFSKYNQIK